MSAVPTTKYAESLPSAISAGRTGVESSCSMVPFSHSRATVSEPRFAAMIITITAISPGTMKFCESRSGLYQTRTCGHDRWQARCPRAALDGHLQVLRIDRDHAFRVALRDGRRVRIAPVDQQLHLR